MAKALFGIHARIWVRICEGLKAKRFASTNLVLGIGSFTYQHVTRDTFGFAMKATYGEVNGKGIEIFKDPVTDNGVKKSAKGLLRVVNVGGNLELEQSVNRLQEMGGELQVVFRDGKKFNTTTLSEIRARLHGGKF